MDDESYLDFIMNEYNSFKTIIKKTISSVSFNFVNCYVIDYSWINNLQKLYKNYNNSISHTKDNNYKKLIQFIQSYPNAINDFSKLINRLANNKTFNLVSLDFIKCLDLNNEIGIEKYLNKSIQCYGQNNKLIMEFKNQQKALLLFNPYDINKILKTSFIIIINNVKKTELYELLLNLNNISII